MKSYPSDKIRNIGVVAHGGAGKTSLVEAILFNTGAVNRLGRVEDGTTTADYHPEETSREGYITITPVQIDLTNNCEMERIKSWGIGFDPRPGANV